MRLHTNGERIIREMWEDQPLPSCNDWLYHEGNVHFARNRSDFDTYTAIDALAYTAPGNEQVGVLGIGTVKLAVRRQLNQHTTMVHPIHPVLHTPAARCNGLSRSFTIEKNGLGIKSRNDGYFTIFDQATKASVLCGTTACGRFRIFRADEPQTSSMVQHVTLPQSINIDVDLLEIDALRKWMASCADTSAVNHYDLSTCDDWLVYSKGNVHFARDRRSFDAYVRVDGHALSANGTQRLPVIGIGTVILFVGNEIYGYGTRHVVMRTVLHIPAARCNGGSQQMLVKAGIVLKRQSGDFFAARETEGQGPLALCGKVFGNRWQVKTGNIVSFGIDCTLHRTHAGNIGIWAHPSAHKDWRSKLAEATKHTIARPDVPLEDPLQVPRWIGFKHKKPECIVCGAITRQIAASTSISVASTKRSTSRTLSLSTRGTNHTSNPAGDGVCSLRRGQDVYTAANLSTPSTFRIAYVTCRNTSTNRTLSKRLSEPARSYAVVPGRRG
ncbi:hypothetical protein LTR36_010540 [Oleoguttula mirabilis]|uniref:Uncharacterized protein n=1 Tax=Oleoguttula mirabilis TaxID=1507867 RepID=A0AAV9J3W2_9PEZI|nr:hypothetical protein LTR36_010540 [Oleoguttula mirabilis]